MAFMGYETPVEMPSMGIYNTDLMKMYIAGVKDQYEKGQEEMKDFMKTYGDFYSDIPGATEAYNNMTIGGARNMINQMLANGIDPYKSPEARAAISRYIASVPTGRLNEMKRSAENAALYKKALAEAQNDPNFDADYNRAMIGGDLETWDPTKPWTATAPYIAPSAEKLFKPYMEKFKQSEILPEDEQDRPGYTKVGTTKESKQGALRAALENYENTPYGQYKRQQANQIAAEATNPDGTPLTPEQRAALAQNIFEQPAKDYARQFFQPAYEDDWKAKMNAQAAKEVQVHRANAATDHYYHVLENPDKYDENGNPIRTSSSRSYVNNTKNEGEYSQYVAITDATHQNIYNSATATNDKGNVTWVYKNSKGKPVYPTRMIVPQKGANGKTEYVDMLVVEDPDGKFKGKSGKKYRKISGEELQTMAMRNRKASRNNWFESISTTDAGGTFKNAFKDFGVDEGFADFIYSPDAVLLNTEYGTGLNLKNCVSNSELRRRYREAIKNSIDQENEDLAPSIVPLHKSGDVYLKNGKRGKYTLAEMRIPTNEDDGTTKYVTSKILVKLGQYVKDQDGKYIIDTKWSAFMDPADMNVSKDSAGSDGVTYLNY